MNVNCNEWLEKEKRTQDNFLMFFLQIKRVNFLSSSGHVLGPSLRENAYTASRTNTLEAGFLEFSCLFLSFEAYVFPSCNSVAYHSLSHNHSLTLSQKSTKAPAFYYSFSPTYSHPHPFCKNPPWLWSWSADQFSLLSLRFWSTGWPLVRFWASSKATNSTMVFWKSWMKHWILSTDSSTMRRRSRLQSVLWRTGSMMLNMLSMKLRTYRRRLIMNIYAPRTWMPLDLTAIGWA